MTSILAGRASSHELLSSASSLPPIVQGRERVGVTRVSTHRNHVRSFALVVVPLGEAARDVTESAQHAGTVGALVPSGELARRTRDAGNHSVLLTSLLLLLLLLLVEHVPLLLLNYVLVLFYNLVVHAVWISAVVGGRGMHHQPGVRAGRRGRGRRVQDHVTCRVPLPEVSRRCCLCRGMLLGRQTSLRGCHDDGCPWQPVRAGRNGGFGREERERVGGGFPAVHTSVQVAVRGGAHGPGIPPSPRPSRPVTPPLRSAPWTPWTGRRSSGLWPCRWWRETPLTSAARSCVAAAGRCRLLGANRQNRATVALMLTHMHSEVTSIWGNNDITD